MQYRPGFLPSGDPRKWNLFRNYLRHQDIYLSRRPGEVVIKIAGSDAGGKAICFPKAYNGVRRIEWGNGVSWEFDDFKWLRRRGRFSRTFLFESAGKTLVRSRVVFIRTPGKKNKADFDSAYAEARKKKPSPTMEAALTRLLSYR